jgi:energy-coupling factor transporter ATP-binding protein EcfA2
MHASHPLLAVFLSYAHEDREVAMRLRTDLDVQGITVWIDTEDIQPGTLDWEEDIRAAIQAAHVVLWIASPSARRSRYVKGELHIAELYQRPIYPVWVAGAKWEEAAPLDRIGTEFIDARKPYYPAGVCKLVEVLRKTPLPPPIPQSLLEAEKEPRNPYKGLRAFTSADARDFFGRETLIKNLCETLKLALSEDQQSSQNARLVALLGPSGSGKSSVMMAGLLPRLHSGALSGSDKWVYLEPIVPGKDLIESLADKLKPLFPDTSFKTLREDLEDKSARGLHLWAMQLVKQREVHVVLLVDQFEELFTLMPEEKEEERRHFIDLLVTATTEPRGALIVLLALRADFYDRPMRYPALHRLIQAHQQPVLPMELDDLRAVIEQPAALPDVRLTFERDLVGDLLFEMPNQVGALPLLEFTLDQLVRECGGHLLTLQAYHQMGGVKGALRKHADKTYDDLPSEDHRRLAQALFIRLIVPGATEQDTARRRAALYEFSLHDAQQTRQMQESIDAFIRARLLTTNDVGGTPTIEVSHEVLLRQWPRLAEWVQKAHEDIPLQQTISNDVAEWERRGRPKDRLYRGSQLKEAQAWATRRLPSENEIAFLQASVARQVQYRVNILVVILLVLSLLTSTGVWVRSFFSPSVTNLNDSGSGSLRQALMTAKSGDKITFDDSLKGTIMLTSQDLNIAQNLTISGSNIGELSISSGDTNHIISVKRNFSVAIYNLTFKDSKLHLHSFVENNGVLTLNHCTVSHNTSDGQGTEGSGGYGGISNYGTLSLIDSTVSDNTAIDNDGGSTTSGSSGGGVYNSGSLTLLNSTVSDNTAGSDNDAFNSGAGYGGGIYNGGNLTVTASTISGNLAGSVGGGIYNIGTLLLANSTISGNKAFGDGGGLEIADVRLGSQATIKFCTIYGNIAGNENILDGNGGGIVNEKNVSGEAPNQVIMQDSIVAGNHASRDPDILGMLLSNGYNLIQNASGATITHETYLVIGEAFSAVLTGIAPDLIGIAPMVRPLQINGGPTLTQALPFGSPALGKIPWDYCQIGDIFNSQSNVYIDQRGMKRPDGNETACDIGAYEAGD